MPPKTEKTKKQQVKKKESGENDYIAHIEGVKGDQIAKKQGKSKQPLDSRGINDASDRLRPEYGNVTT